MTIRTQVLLAALAMLGFAGESVAQPIAPPRRPIFSSYGSLFSPGGGYYGYGYGGPGMMMGGGMYGGLGMMYGGGMYGGGYGGYGGFGWGGPGFGRGFGGNGMMMQQNLQLQQQLGNLNQNLANLQTQLATGVNSNIPVTGHGAVFSQYGHWYPSLSGGGMMGGMMGGLMSGKVGRGTAGIGYPVGGGTSAPPGGGAGAPARTAGTGIPIGQSPRK
jgi:heterogeneous nuclear ribonucleoprotein A1/A3